MAQQDEKNMAASGFVRPSNQRRLLHSQPQKASILEPNQPQALPHVSFCFNKQTSTTRSRCMTARTRYQRISTFFGRRIPNTIYLLHLIEEYDACVSALFVALCTFFFAARYRTGGPTSHTPVSF